MFFYFWTFYCLIVIGESPLQLNVFWILRMIDICVQVDGFLFLGKTF